MRFGTVLARLTLCGALFVATLTGAHSARADPPSISGDTIVGQEVTLDGGTYSPAITSYYLYVEACEQQNGSSCRFVGGSFTQYASLLLYPDEEGMYLRLKVRQCCSNSTPWAAITGFYGPIRTLRTVSITVDGNGSIASNIGGISCPSVCSNTVLSGNTVTLTATPTSGWQFTGWSGACNVATTTCSIAINGDKSITATFSPIASGGSSGSSTSSGSNALSNGNAATPTQPEQVEWSQPAKRKPLEASFKAESGTTYSIRATLKKKSVSGTCSVTKGTATCSIKLKSPGKWSVAITPSKGGVKGKPASKTVRV